MKKKGKQIIFHILLILLALLWMAPVVTMFITAPKSQGDFYSGSSLFSLPDQLKWSNFTDAWTKGRLGTYMKNGPIICLLKVLLGILVESLAVFVVTRPNIKHKTVIFVFFLLGMMLPHQVALIPLNCASSNYNLINNYAGLFVMYTGFSIGYGISMSRGFTRSIPKDLDEAAYIDGCGKPRLYYNIIPPIIRPATATVFIVDFLNTWNEFLLQSTLITSDSLRTMLNGLMSSIREYGTDYGLLNAGVLISTVPVPVVYLSFQKYFVEGMVGAVKQQEPKDGSPANRRCKTLKNKHEKENITVYSNYHSRIPEGKMVRLIVNTDAKSEADDQYAIVHALLSPKFDNQGVIVAYFGNGKSPHSMKDSHDEVLKMLDLMDFSRDLACKRADRRLPDEKTPAESQGARLIIEEAMKESDMPLCVIFLGPLTNMASAYPMEPRITGRLTCIQVGGGKYSEGGYEYNLNNDIRLARVVMNSDMPVWQIPRNMYNQVIVPLVELEHKVCPCRKLGRYLSDQLEEHGHTSSARAITRTGEYWCLGDSPAVGVLLFAHMFGYNWVQAPLVMDNMICVKNSQDRPIRVYNRVDHRFILEDFHAKLALLINK